jgi:hypothetical protein
MENPGCPGGNNGKSRLPGLASSRLKPVLLAASICGTGFSREGVSGNNEKSRLLGRQQWKIQVARAGLFPAEAGPTGRIHLWDRLKPVLLDAFICRTGFSREGASGNNEKSSVSGPAASLLMPLP